MGTRVFEALYPFFVVLFFEHLAFATLFLFPSPQQVYYIVSVVLDLYCRDMASLINTLTNSRLEVWEFFLSDSFNAQRMNIFRMHND